MAVSTRLIADFARCGGAIATDADPVKLITAIYQTYTIDNTPVVPNVYSRRLQALIDTDAKNTPPGDAGTIDWDVFVDGNKHRSMPPGWLLSSCCCCEEASGLDRRP